VVLYVQFRFGGAVDGNYLGCDCHGECGPLRHCSVVFSRYDLGFLPDYDVMTDGDGWFYVGMDFSKIIRSAAKRIPYFF
jgi:hypothetical protein